MNIVLNIGIGIDERDIFKQNNQYWMAAIPKDKFNTMRLPLAGVVKLGIQNDSMRVKQ